MKSRYLYKIKDVEKMKIAFNHWFDQTSPQE